MQHKTLIFSIALNGYQWLYSKQLKSHFRYAKKYGYAHQTVTRPYFSSLGVECCWLKLTLMRSALLAGYSNVVFLDADAMVQENCPPITSLFVANKYLYMAKGYSNRFNSGVLIARNNKQVISWLKQVINSRTIQVPTDDSVGWGENGHIIQHSHNCPFIKEIAQKWNNTHDENLDDFIRHQNSGPLRAGLVTNFIHKVIFCLSYRILYSNNKCISLFKTLKKQQGDDNNLYQEQRNQELLEQETNKVLSYYPSFAALSK